MKKVLLLSSLGAASLLSADPYYHGHYQSNYQGYYSQPSYQQSYYTQPSYQQGYYSQPGYQQGYYSQPQSSCPGGNCPYAQTNYPYYQAQSHHDIQPYYEDWQTNQMDPYYQPRPQMYSNTQQPNQTANKNNLNNPNQNMNPGYSQSNMDQMNSNYNQNRFMQDGTMYGQNRDMRNQKMVPDQEIARNVHDVLSAGWTTKGYPNVTFDVNNGIVTLRGTVDTSDDKTSVEEKIRKIEGVRQLNSQLAVGSDRAAMAYYERDDMMADNAYGRDNAYVKDNAYGKDTDSRYSKEESKYPQDYAATETDRQLNKKIRDKISNGWFSDSYATVILRTTNGVVIVSGTVEDFKDAQKVIDNIRKIEGVRNVNNQLSVKAPE